jgi:hypothetical protein
MNDTHYLETNMSKGNIQVREQEVNPYASYADFYKIFSEDLKAWALSGIDPGGAYEIWPGPRNPFPAARVFQNGPRRQEPLRSAPSAPS